jgi:Na+/phosphate symporter
MIIYLSLFVCIVGLILYLAAANPKPMEVGRLMFGCGLLVFLFETGMKIFPFLR